MSAGANRYWCCLAASCLMQRRERTTGVVGVEPTAGGFGVCCHLPLPHPSNPLAFTHPQALYRAMRWQARPHQRPQVLAIAIGQAATGTGKRLPSGPLPQTWHDFKKPWLCGLKIKERPPELSIPNDQPKGCLLFFIHAPAVSQNIQILHQAMRQRRIQGKELCSFELSHTLGRQR
jgi:hypothetical protein